MRRWGAFRLDYRLGLDSRVCFWRRHGGLRLERLRLSFLQDFGIRIPPQFTSARGEVLVKYNGNWEHLCAD